MAGRFMYFHLEQEASLGWPLSQNPEHYSQLERSVELDSQLVNPVEFRTQSLIKVFFRTQSNSRSEKFLERWSKLDLILAGV